MEAADALVAIASLNDEQKKYVNGFFAVVIASDGNADDSEIKIWSLISAFCNLPTMTIGEALHFWANH